MPGKTKNGCEANNDQEGLHNDAPDMRSLLLIHVSGSVRCDC